MKEINSTNGFENSKKSLMEGIKYNYGAMMLGLDKFDKLYSYYPLWYDEDKTLILYEAEWMTTFKSPLEEKAGRESWEQILNCTKTSTKFPRPTKLGNQISNYET